MAKTPPKEKEDKPKQKKEAKPKPQKSEEAPIEKEGFRGIVRIAGKDIKGNVSLRNSLFHVRGIGHSLALSVSNLLSNEAGIQTDVQVGDLSDSQIEKIDSILFNLQNYNIPKFLLNRRADKQEGSDRHVIMNDLIFAVREDVEGEKKLYSWKGYRHSYGQKVRGQKTRNTGRTGMAVGVLRKAVLAQAAAAKAEAAPAKGGTAPALAKAGEKPAAAPAAAPAAKPAAKPAEKK
jgi:small subunit ribosomal protein S13